MCLDRRGIIPSSRVPCRGLPTGRLTARDSGGLKESLPAPWGIFWVYLWGVGLGRHGDPVRPVEDPPLGVCFENVGGGMCGGCVEGIRRCDSYFPAGRLEARGGGAA